MDHKNWNGFAAGVWRDEINVRDFIQANYAPYSGDAAFLAGPTARTEALMKKLQNLFALERQFGGVLDIDTATVSSLTSFSPGYIDKDNEIIVGMQTNRPLKRSVNPFGGMRMVRQACEAYGYTLSPTVEEEVRSAPPTTTACSARTPPKCVPPANVTSSRDSPMRTVAAVSSVTTAVWHCTVSTA